MTRGLLFNLQRFSTHDGPGIRTTVFLKGCPLHCAWCHNPESLRPQVEVMHDPARCIDCRGCAGARTAGEEAEACPSGAKRLAGWETTVPELVERLCADRPYFEESGGGVTFSGGEPLSQGPFLLEALAACRAQGLSTALDTCGFASRDLLLSAAALSDVVLFDLKGVDDARHRASTGVPATPILENLRALCAAHPRVWIRVPLVPGHTDDPQELEAAADILSTLRLEKVCLLPYHALGTAKACQLGFAPDTFLPPSQDACTEALDPFLARGLTAQIGG